MAYRLQSITIRKEDYKKADAIVQEHWKRGDIDAENVTEEIRYGGVRTVTFWLNMYVSDDLETIKREFVQSGIELL